MSYDPAALSTPLNYVRLLIGDTSGDASSEMLTDEELKHFIDNEVSTLYAAARAADVLASKYAGDITSKSADGKSISRSRFNDYKTLAKKLRADARRENPGKPYAGGTSVADKTTVEQNSDRDAPAFELGMHDVVDDVQPSSAGPLP